MFKLVLEKAKEPEIKLSTSAGSWKKQENSRKTSYFCFIDYAKAFDCVDHNKLWKILQEMGIPDCIICLLRNHIKVKSLNHVRPFVTPWTVASSVHGVAKNRAQLSDFTFTFNLQLEAKTKTIVPAVVFITGNEMMLTAQ